MHVGLAVVKQVLARAVVLIVRLAACMIRLEKKEAQDGAQEG